MPSQTPIYRQKYSLFWNLTSEELATMLFAALGSEICGACCTYLYVSWSLECFAPSENTSET
jgi:hypothetical protein